MDFDQHNESEEGCMDAPKEPMKPSPPQSGGDQNQKQMGYKRKQNASNQRNLPGQMAASGITTVQDNVDSCANVPSAESCAPSNANTKDDHPQQQQQQHKKRNNRVAKNKHRTDESLSITTSPSLEPTEMSSAKALTETKNVTPETLPAAGSEKVETSRAALKAGDPQHEGLVSAGHGFSQPAEDAHGRTTGHWKAQSHRRVSRNTHSIRPVEKFHGNEGTIWAPVRTWINKSEPFDESSQHVNMNSGLSSGKTSHGKAGLEKKNAEVKQNKNGRMHASWRQCSPVESSTGLQSSKERPTSSSDPSKIMYKSADQEHTPQTDFPSQKQQDKYSDGWNMEPVLQEVTAPIIVKDHGGPGSRPDGPRKDTQKQD